MKARQARHHAESRAAVMARAGGRCEGCGVTARLEWAHLAGRRHVVGEPMASSPALTAALCAPCHRAIDEGRDPERLRGLRILGVLRVCEQASMTPPPWTEEEPLAAIRTVCRQIV